MLPARLSISAVVLGLVVAGAVLAVTGAARTGPTAGAVLSDCDGSIRELVIQYTPSAAEISGPVYREFLPQLPAGVTVQVVCPDRAAYDDLLTRVGSVSCRLRPVVVGHAMTTWSRDRWLAMSPSGWLGDRVLLAPAGERAQEVWPDRKGDALIAADLAEKLDDLATVRSSLQFDGGDFVADDRTVFVTPAVLSRNLQTTVPAREELLARLEQTLKRRVVLIETAPDHHAGMYLMPAGNNTVLVGDPRGAAAIDPAQDGDFSPATQELFDAVADRCTAAGYRVIRMPLVPGRDGRTYITYLNAILDQRDGRHIVYMPTFDGADALNVAGAAIWRAAGYDVRPVNCTSSYRHFGSLRCLVNVLQRG